MPSPYSSRRRRRRRHLLPLLLLLLCFLAAFTAASRATEHPGSSLSRRDDKDDKSSSEEKGSGDDNKDDSKEDKEVNKEEKKDDKEDDKKEDDKKEDDKKEDDKKEDDKKEDDKKEDDKEDNKDDEVDKYFHEPGGNPARDHYDVRFFVDDVPYDEHRLALRDLIRSYLATMHHLGVETWLAHGTLLGWWWNGRVMPWDHDLDVQVSNATMLWMGDHLNRTQHAYNSSVDGAPVTRHYMLDINPHHVEIDIGNGLNIIDARWIDLANGMFIDITALRERESDWPGHWSCKNNHRYQSQELWPMRVSEFEGVRTRIPYSFEKILVQEYGPESLVSEEFEGHRWDRNIKEWVKMPPEEENKHD